MNRLARLAVPALALAVSLGCSPKAQGQSLETEDQKTIYAIGLAISQNLGQFEFSEEEMKILSAGLSDGALKRDPKVKLDEYGPKIQAFAQARMTAAAEKEKVAAAKFLTDEAAKAGATKTDSGLIYTEISAGTGNLPAATDSVTVHYKGTLRDGTVFDSSLERGQPATFQLNQVIGCWTEGVQKMKVGGKSRLVCPAAIAYGDRGAPPTIPPGAALVFEVELLSIGAPAAAPAPAPSSP
jgi:FKBP-type peptidyl-prolyl cis-trans isomerase FkpA